MNFDALWICPDSERSCWAERGAAEKRGTGERFRKALDRMYARGNLVTLSHASEVAVDELYVFGNAADAVAFFESGYRSCQFRRADGSVIGFEEIALYLGGRRRAVKEDKGLVPGCERSWLNTWRS
jgi:hypothetical protein